MLKLCKREHPLLPADIFKAMSKNTHLYPDFMKLFKLSLLILPSTANVEGGFSVLTMLHIKYCNSLLPNSLNKLMRLVLLGAPTLSDETWKAWWIDSIKGMSDDFRQILGRF